jgi:hypothetical protein
VSLCDLVDRQAFLRRLEQQRAREEKSASQRSRFLFLVSTARSKWNSSNFAELCEVMSKDYVSQLVGVLTNAKG